MCPSSIVIHLHIFKDLSFCFLARQEPAPVSQLHFERVEKTLSNGIVPTIAFPAHTADKLVIAQDLLEIIPGILAAPVRMTNQTLLRISP